MGRLESREADHGKKPLTGILIQTLQPEMGQDPVLADNRHQVRGYAHDSQVQQRLELAERNPVSCRITLDKLESHTASRQVVKRIGAVLPLRVEHGHSCRKVILGEMMVTDNHIYTLGCRISHLVIGLYTAVESDNQCETV